MSVSFESVYVRLGELARAEKAGIPARRLIWYADWKRLKIEGRDRWWTFVEIGRYMGVRPESAYKWWWAHKSLFESRRMGTHSNAPLKVRLK